MAPPAPLTKAQLLELHAPPPELDGKRDLFLTMDLPGAPSALWPLLSDTSRLNRAVGTAEMTFYEKDGKRFGRSKAGGIAHDWLEVPWNWVAEQWLTSTRIYDRGLMTASYAIHRLEPIETGTRVYIYYAAVPRSALAAFAIRIGFGSIGRALRRVLPQIAAQLDRPVPEVLRAPPPPLAGEASHRLDVGRDQLLGEGLPKDLVDRFVELIRTGDDADLHRIQVRALARTWKQPETDVLRTALHATRAGLLELSWDTICPHCRGLREEAGALSDVGAEARCEVCEIDFTTDAQEAVEVTFRVHSSIREVPEQLYCSAEPARRDHIRVQTTLPPGGKTVLRPRFAPGRYTVWAGHRGGWYVDVDDDGPPELVWDDHPEGTIVRACAAPAVHLANDGAEPETFTIERAKWSDDALRAGTLLGMQEFRDLFSKEYLGADVKLAVGEQTVLFTDVVGSTAFYAARGDPGAFVEIKKHFDELFAIVRTNHGAIVKTIGDAIMATFVSPLDALRAARAIHGAYSPARTDTPIRVRISLNTGACIAVRLNSNIDFFGGTVNVAAKLQALAEAYQIAIGEPTYRTAGVAEYLAEQQADVEDMQYESKALGEPIRVKRWTVFRS